MDRLKIAMNENEENAGTADKTGMNSLQVLISSCLLIMSVCDSSLLNNRKAILFSSSPLERGDINTKFTNYVAYMTGMGRIIP